MKKALFLATFLLNSLVLFAQNEIGPEGHKLVWVFVVVVVIAAIFILSAKPFKTKKSGAHQALFRRRNLKVELSKDRLYYPDNVKLTIHNSGTTDLDIDKPLLVFDNFWLKRKFKLKGMENHHFYPLFLEVGKTHTLNIDLNRFYQHDKSLKKFPKAKVVLLDVKGKKLGSKSVYLRKTLLKF
jgi:hypothetical protein